VPVYTISAAAFPGEPLREKDLQKNWFSDGGICSNFPIHFFDAWFPTRPTFGVNLATFAPNIATTGQIELARTRQLPVVNNVVRGQDVFLPRATEPIPPQFSEISGFGQFIGSVLGTAKDYHDKTQSGLASYRERIVQIRLLDSEGGLNLDMPENAIRRVISKGEDAGRVLKDFRFDEHQWVRFRVLMKEFESSLQEMYKAVGADGKGPAFDLADLFAAQLSSGRDFAFPLHDKEKWKELFSRICAITGLIDSWNEAPSFQDIAVRPEPVLRVVPRRL
jgi:hypothetical protein